MGKIVTTSIRIDEDLWKKAKIKSIQNGITITEFLNEALKEKLKQ